jgi:glycerol-3-phosphate cytidylyltransferase
MDKNNLNKKKIVLTYGTFDMFHIGHLNLLKRAKSYGDYLIVGISTDEFNKKKGKNSIIPFNERKKIVESIKYVDKVIEEKEWEQKIKDIIKYKVDYFVMGDDWKGKFDELNKFCKVIYLPRTEGISTTSFKKSAKTLLAFLEQLIKELK